MAINRSTQYFTLDGLTVFKETVIKNYAKLGTIDAQINSAIYNAMMQYKRDIAKFVPTEYELPQTGNPGTLYMVPKHIDDNRYKPKTNEIWLTCEDAPFATMRLIVTYQNPSRSNVTIDLVENEYGFFVLDINKITSEMSSSAITNSTGVNLRLLSESNGNYLQIPSTGNTYWYVKNDLIPMGGSIISIQNRYPLSNIVPIPQVYVGNKPNVTANIPEDEIWVDGTDWPTLVMHFKSSSEVLELHKNEYNYYVINKSDIDNIITGTTIRVSCSTQDNTLKTSGDINYVGQPIYTTNIATYLGGKRIILRKDYSYIHTIPASLPIITYTGDNGDQVVTYAYENGKYITLGSTKFALDDFDIDRGLDGNSLNALQNKVIYEALQPKYDTANMIDSVTVDDNNLVTSRGIQAALAPKLGWDDLRNITLYQLMRELRFSWNMPTEMYFKLVVYAPLKEQDLAIFYPTLTQRMQFFTFAISTGSFVSTDNTFNYNSYNGTKSKYIDNNTGNDVWLQNRFDIAMASSVSAVSLFVGGNANFIGNTGSDIQFTITSENPVNINTLANLSYKFRAYSSNESSTHSHINKIYVSTYLSPDGVDWHQLQNKTIYKWDDNYEELNDYIYLIPILA